MMLLFKARAGRPDLGLNILRLAFVALSFTLMLLGGTAHAATCSPYKGQVFINELRIGASGYTDVRNQVEIVNTAGVPASVWQTWQVVVYYRYSLLVYRMGGYYLSSGFTANGAFIYNNTKPIYLRNASSSFLITRNVEVILLDGSGNVIDDVALDGRIVSLPSCFGSAPVVNITSSGDSVGNVSRATDGGSWPGSVNNTSRHTIGANNTCTAGGGDVVVDLSATPTSPIVGTTTTTYTLTATNKSCTTSVSGITVATTSLVNSNFSGSSTSVSQGTTSAGSGLTWTVGALAAGAQATLTYSGKPKATGTLTATSTLTAPTSGLLNTADDSDSATITVRDKNYVGFEVSTDSVTEGTDTTYTVKVRSSLVATNAITVRYSVSGTALPVVDTDLGTTGVVTIDPTADLRDEAAFTFTIKDDALPESTKAIVLTLTSVSSTDTQVAMDPTANTLTITLNDDDATAPHHLELRHASGSGLTCAADAVTVRACQDASCTTPYTDGVTGTLSSSHLATLWPSTPAFVIPAGSSSVSVPFQLPLAGSATLGVSTSLPVAANALSCNFTGCSYTAADGGLLLSVPNHIAGTSQTLSLRAVRKSDSSTACVAAFAGLARTLLMSCSYANPSSGSKPVTAGGKALNSSNTSGAACDGNTQSLLLNFDVTGLANTTLTYPDAGQVTVAASYVGSSLTSDLGLNLLGNTSFIAAPASLSLGSVTAAPLRAGTAFSATVTALNSAGVATPNFGRETSPATATLAFTRTAPTGTGASNGVFSGTLGSFSSGSATASNLSWSEVGSGTLTATLSGSTGYLGSGLVPTAGSTSVGPFIPHHFNVAATPACGIFSYSGQPFTVSVTAMNGLAMPSITTNYDGTGALTPVQAQAVSLSDTAGLIGSWSNANLAASRFTAGVASVSTPSFTFTNKLTAPQSVVLRATDANGANSSGGLEPSMPLRSGRLRLFNAFGNNTSPLSMAVQTQYWSGKAWVLNSADSCSVVPSTAVASAQVLDHQGKATSAWTTSPTTLSVSGGHATLTVQPPPGGRAGSVDLSLNLGSTTLDASCQSSHPTTVGAGLPWLRARNGACGTTWDADPSARATFGVQPAETRRTVHVQEVF